MSKTYTAADYIAPAVSELVKEITAGKLVATLAAEIATTYAAQNWGQDADPVELDADDFETAIKNACDAATPRERVLLLATGERIAAEEGAAWAAELLAEMDADGRAAWIASAQRDPRGWWTACAFDTVRDRVSAALWADKKHELCQAAADACAAVILDDADQEAADQEAADRSDGWHAFEAEGFACHVKFEGRIPVKVSIKNDSEESAEDDAIEEAIEARWGVWVEIGEWESADGSTVEAVADLKVEEQPTHRVTFTPARGEPSVALVYLPEDSGPAYDRREWRDAQNASWSVDEDGGWYCQGQATPGGESGAVEVVRLKR